MRKWYNMTGDTVLQELQSNASTGLSDTEVAQRLQQYGANEFESKKPESLFSKVRRQLTDISTIILLVAAAMSLLLAIKDGHGFLEPIVILSIIILNTVLGITQERSAEKSLEALTSLNSPNALILRSSSQIEVSTSQLVPGDILLLKTGDRVPADARLLQSVDLTVDESALTGESEPREKEAAQVFEPDTPLADQNNMVFSGCFVAGGRATAIVTDTGMKTEIGKIAGYLNQESAHKTPLQVRLGKVSKFVSIIAILAAFLLFMIGIIQGTDFWSILMLSVTLAVAAVPETLALIVTLILSNGVKKMVKKEAIIRKLTAVETLGSVSVICSDKTGTLTQNQMTVKKLWLCGNEPVKADADLQDNETLFVEMLALACNASVEQTEDGCTIIGDATEKSIMRLAVEKEVDLDNLSYLYPRINEIPFSSSRKRMTVILVDPEGGYLVVSKGAYDWMPMASVSEEEKAQEHMVHKEFAEQALRVIALATKHIDALPDEGDLESVESDLHLMGMVGIIDPPRPESAPAIEAARSAGIRTIMITGDNEVTASAIAREINLLNEGQKVMNGTKLASMSDTELINCVKDYSVYARATPEDKIRIVSAWQACGDVVAMTGDGVNDAPALKTADVGVAMGSGTEVAKGVADMILTTDNFSTIVDAVHEGRNVFSNIRKTLYFLLVCNVSEIILMLVGQLLGWGAVVSAVMLLIVNVLGDGIPGLQLAKETSDPRIMERKPIGRTESFFNSSLIRVISIQTIVCAAVVLAGYYFGAFVVMGSMAPNPELGQTMAFFVLSWTSVLHIFTVRRRKSIFKSELYKNKPLIISALSMLFLFVILIATPLQNLFGLTSLDSLHWIAGIILSLIPTIVAEIDKAYSFFLEKQKYKKQNNNTSTITR